MAKMDEDKLQIPPKEGTPEKEKKARPESDVFISPQVSVDPDTIGSRGLSRTDRQPLDSGYMTGTSVGTSVSSVVPGTDVDTDWQGDPAQFYMSQDSVEEILELQEDSSDDEDVCHSSERTVISPTSPPLDIPGASSHHQVHHEALAMMDATPPRSYPTPPITLDGHHFSTGCLSHSAQIAQMLLHRKGSHTGDLMETGLNVASGHLNVSRSRTQLHRQRTISASEAQQDDVTFPQRDRSVSAPDLGARQRLIERQCAAELRKISDEFFEDFPRTKGKASRGRYPSASMATHARSYPGTSGARQWWWQTIIQNLSPARGGRATTPSNTMTTQDTTQR